MAAGKKQRKPKTSKGQHGGGGKVHTLTEVQKVNWNKGLMVGVANRWKKATPAEPSLDELVSAEKHRNRSSRRKYKDARSIRRSTAVLNKLA